MLCTFRWFAARSATTPSGFALLVAVGLLATFSAPGAEWWVSPRGDDTDGGTRDRPFATLARAQREARKVARREAVSVILTGGTHYLPETFRLEAEDSGEAAHPVEYRAADGERPVVSGGLLLKLAWEAHERGIWRARVPADLALDQLFVNGTRQHQARYPNYDPQVRHFNGYAADAFSTARAARWQDPRGAFLHAMHRHEWGDFHFVVTGKGPDGALKYEGGWQNNRRLGIHGEFRMVENVFEELDAPGEWFHDRAEGWLYLLPIPGVTLSNATVEAVRLRHLVEFHGTREQPLRFVRWRGLTFRHTARTFMDNKEPLLRSDWTTYRGGAVVFEGTEDCGLDDCDFDQVGGNAVFVNAYNRRVTLRGLQIANAGANGVAFVGSPQAVRSPLFEYEQRQALTEIDRAPGPKTPDYPGECLVEDCLIYRSGRFEKQTAPIQIAMSQGITVRHCSLYDVPRAGINIGDGCWGGHVIEFCDIFDTVLETGDHGSFNSWGRDRFWGLKGVDLDTVTQGDLRDLPRLDVVQPIVLRNNRWRCDHGWDIDLDDGSSNYELRNNLCLNGGIKLREGFYRVVENNVMVNNSFHPHVWYRHSEDVFRHNIVFAAYRPIRVERPWGRACDANLLHEPGATAARPADVLREQSGLDERSRVADAQFVDPARGDYRVRDDSPALALGFVNFAMDQFGVQRPRLRALARTPRLPEVAGLAKEPGREEPARDWLGARIKTLGTLGEASAVGIDLAAGGVLFADVPAGSAAADAGFRALDLLQACEGRTVKSLGDLRTRLGEVTRPGKVRLTIRRDQRSRELTVQLPADPIP